ncbi:MAG: glycoside hydrolase domain-containing protein [Actinocrinis sp.]
MTVGVALAVPPLPLVPQVPGSAAGPPIARHGQTVTYLGRDYVVPYSWPVVNLAEYPATCVRFDVHAVYLGAPSAEQDCPARGVGRRTGALLIEPEPARSAAGGVGESAVSLDRPISGEIDVTAPGVSVVASYGDDDRSTVIEAITGAGLPQPANAPVTPATVPVEIVRGTYQVTGLGFDTCSAPSAARMKAWAVSPFSAVGIYVGGSERACSQANLTAPWIAAQAKAGWHFMPLYAGWQAAWDSLTATKTAPAPATLGTQSADDAVNHARALGFGPGSLLHYDMESYRTSAQSKAAIAFLSAWTTELHKRGYRSGVYSSASTGIADLVAHRGTMTEPDVVDIAHWNGIADGDPTSTPADAWPTQRTHQYLGNLDATYGGVKLNIDQDYLSIAAACSGPTPAPSPTPSATPSAAPSATPTSVPSPTPSSTAPLPSTSATASPASTPRQSASPGSARGGPAASNRLDAC